MLEQVELHMQLVKMHYVVQVQLYSKLTDLTACENLLLLVFVHCSKCCKVRKESHLSLDKHVHNL